MTEGVEGGQGEGGEVVVMIRGDRIIIAVATMTGEGESYTHMHTQAHERNQWPPVILYSVMHNYTLSLSLLLLLQFVRPPSTGAPLFRLRSPLGAG